MKKLQNFNTKTIKRLILAALAAAAAIFVSSTSASAQLIGAQFSQGADVFAGTGLLGESFTDPIIGSGSSVVQNFGPTEIGLSGVDIALTTVGTDYFNSTGATGAGIYADDLNSRKNDTITITLSDLIAGNLYDIAFYAGNYTNSNNNDPVGLTVNGVATTGVTGAANVAPTQTLGVNAFVDDLVTADVHGDITLVATTGGGSSYNPINGVGIEAVAATPEPSSWALVVAGAGAMVGLQTLRRRNA